MTKETVLQSDVIEGVRAAGGAARKLSHRFLIGVSDLLVKMPGAPAALIEVKKDTMPTRGYTITIKPDLTVLQRKFLEEFHRAGMPAYVLSFLIGNKRRKWAALVHIRDWEDNNAVSTSLYSSLDTSGPLWKVNLANHIAQTIAKDRL